MPIFAGISYNFPGCGRISGDRKHAERWKIFWITKGEFSYLRPKFEKTMAVTRLKRKDKRNKAVAKARVQRIKQLTLTPVIKKVDVEELKKSFATA